MIDNYFDENALFQKTPTIRIQLPGEKATPYHSDGWYGHGEVVKSFWVPLTSVDQNNTLYMAKNINESLKFIESTIKNKPSYSQISKEAKKICKPLIGKVGDIFVFSSDMIHGTEISGEKNTRLSFDFRIANDPYNLGTKPRTNFYSKNEIKNLSFKKNNKILTGYFYTNSCNNKSSKSQLLMCKTYSEQNKINIIGGDSEILALSYLPVLRSYLEDKTLKINCVVVYGVEIFNSNKKLAKEILKLSISEKIELIFCSEDIHFSRSAQIEEILNHLN